MSHEQKSQIWVNFNENWTQICNFILKYSVCVKTEKTEIWVTYAQIWVNFNRISEIWVTYSDLGKLHSNFIEFWVKFTHNYLIYSFLSMFGFDENLVILNVNFNQNLTYVSLTHFWVEPFELDTFVQFWNNWYLSNKAS